MSHSFDHRRLCGVAWRRLPDFLLDPSLLSDDDSGRLNEWLERWTQLIDSFWEWPDATFWLRITNDPSTRQVQIGLLARPDDDGAVAALQADIELALEAHGFASDVRDELRYARLGPSVRRELDPVFAALLRPWPASSALRVVTPEIIDHAWRNASAVREVIETIGGFREMEPRAWLPGRWSGPRGTFVAPFHSISKSHTQHMTAICLRPRRRVELAVEEEWIRGLAAAAKRLASDDDALHKDPGADAVIEYCKWLITGVFSRAFSVAAIVVGEAESSSQVESLARTLCTLASGGSSLALPEDAKALPASAVSVCPDRGAVSAPSVLDSLNTFTMLPLEGFQESPVHLGNIPGLSNACCAATLFRLPISARAGIPGVHVEQIAPSFVSVGKSSESNTVCLGRFTDGQPCKISVREFSRHTLITGFTGSGKTNTVIHLLRSLYLQHNVPFLVIESAKREYRALLADAAFREGPNRLRVFTLGNEVTAPLRLNPFMLLPGTRVESHVSRLQACLEAALPPMPFLPSILAEALVEVYRRSGFVLTDTFDAPSGTVDTFPRLSDFYDTLSDVIKLRGYQDKTGADVRAASLGRVKQLMLGSVGFMLNPQRDERSVDPRLLFETPCVLELEDLNHQDKSLMVMLVLSFLRTWRSAFQSKTLRHITVVEEAHNVVGRVESQGTGEGAGSDVRARAVEMFTNMLTEVRAFGEGIIISDQSPAKLAKDVSRNTNIQIAHQLRDAADREAMGDSMVMHPEQIEYVGKMPPGRAAVFVTGYERTTYVDVNQVLIAGGDKEDTRVPDDDQKALVDIKRHMNDDVKHVRRLANPFDACQLCLSRRTCDYRNAARRLVSDQHASSHRVMTAGFERWLSRDRERGNRLVAQAARIGAVQMEAKGSIDAGWCYFLHFAATHPVIKHVRLTPENRRAFESGFTSLSVSANRGPVRQKPEVTNGE